ncbi:3-deoxy-D-manno-octulosonic acid transferase [Pseudogemmobacter blasticus]|uniref:3-deoxy-D-manno-octulosonic acid transferase n=1 Tax=Fuscovulum blasticum DSM 2131 TaxID=1188250 RepID=A0A2T4JES6_FUSBL|nr:glycosyltransferase N-terminal domain-containing protein [Fuscovulum blasticum]PTE16308.1 3-deoxy-D-manno-octulosonic acid transferase [Fuscovulum blasticum DSM 2131]
MAGSIGLRLYTLAQRRDPAAETDRPARPPGRLVWLHAGGSTAGLLELARRLTDEEGLTVLLTGVSESGPADSGVILQPAPPDTPADARAFLDHWRPDVALWSDGELRPVLLHTAADRGLTLLMADARLPRLLRDRDGWYPGLLRSTLGLFSQIFALDPASAQAFRRAGALPSAVTYAGRMEERSAVLPCLEAERQALAQMLASRPRWLAAVLPEDEVDSIITAHRTAMGLAHRLLLIVMPERPEAAESLAQRLEGDGWSVALRSAEQEPEPETEIYVVDHPSELGLWYRLAPITFLGGSLAGPGAIRNPMEPASLGSAILHGPRPGAHGSALGRLGAARAARAVASPGDLAEALGDLLSPDRAARLAQAAWTVVSEGVEVTEAVLARIRRELEGRG